MSGKKYSVALSNKKDMNELVKVICEKTGKNEEALRDKFKMVKQADTKTVLDLCKFLKLKFTMDPTGKHNMISVEIPYDKMVKETAPEEPSEEPTKEETPSEETEEAQEHLPPGEEPEDDDPF